MITVIEKVYIQYHPYIQTNDESRLLAKAWWHGEV